MPLKIALRDRTSIPIEVDTVRMEDVRLQSADKVKATLVQNGNRQLPLGEFFDVSGSCAEDSEIVWEGDCSNVKLIGHKLTAGRVRVAGHAGMHLGAEMSGGEIVCEGNAADWVGAEMHGGRIQVRGHAGHMAGAVYRGGFRGMTNGEILIHGNAGNEIGHGMRRGLIAVGGRSGDVPGVGLIAGTLLLFGEAGIRPGAGMKRGTIAFFDSATAPDMLPTFKPSGLCQPVFMRLYLRHLKTLNFPVPDGLLDCSWRRYAGDFLELGKGEILVRAA